MDSFQFFNLLKDNLLYLILFVVGLAVLSYFIAQLIFVRIGKLIIKRSANKTDDILFKHLHLKSLALVVPAGVILAFAAFFPEGAYNIIRPASILIITWLLALGLTSFLNGVNAAYEERPSYNGVSIKSYIDIIRLIVVLIALIISVSILTQKSPMVLLAGLGAVAAVLMLIFQNTILSLVASIQIMTNDLVKEGDFIEVPSFHANGTVIEISLHTIRVRNADMTYSHIPTYKVLDTGFVNWRGMTESKSRRIKRALILDQTSIRLWDEGLQSQLTATHLMSDFATLMATKSSDESQTNSAIFREYVLFYLQSREDIYQEGKTLLVRMLAPDPFGVPLELIAFTKTTVWNEYEAIQSEIFEHLLAVLGIFGLGVNQTGAVLGVGDNQGS